MGDYIDEVYAPLALSEVFSEIPRQASNPGRKESDGDGKDEDSSPVKLTLSPAAKGMLSKISSEGESPVSEMEASDKDSGRADDSGAEGKDEAEWRSGREAKSQGGYAPAEREMLAKLRQRDLEVKAHEQQHMAAAGGYARGGPVYDYQAGPDGRMYAVGGSVALDTGPVPSNPEATVKKAQTLRRAAMAVGDPSPQDRAVASDASQMELEAKRDAEEERKKASGSKLSIQA